MTVQKQLRSQLITMQTPPYAGEIRAWSTKANISLSNLLRESLERGWPVVRQPLIDKHGQLSAAERLHGEVTSIVPVDDRPAYLAVRRRELLKTQRDRAEYAALINPPVPAGAE